MARAESPLKARSAGAGKASTAEPHQQGSWPLDASGEPMVQITFQASELIGLKDYSNITVGPANITTFVPKGQPYAFTDDEAKAVTKAVNQVAQILEEDVIAEQRGIALGTIDPSKQH